MLLNLSNHPVSEWTLEQLSVAEQDFGKVLDEPFPMIPPEYSGEEVLKLAERYLGICQNILGLPAQGNAVMLSGEIVFCSLLSHMLLDAGYRVICATTTREVINRGNGIVERKFKFIRFRDYLK
jgi:hypothetical protein